MSRSMQTNTRGRGGKAGGKAGKRTLGDGARQALLDAYAAADAGRHGDAADAFEALAKTAADRGKPAAAAHISVHGALAALAGDDLSRAVAIGEAGLELSAGVADQRRVARKFWPFVDALKAADADAGASFLEATRTAFGLKLIPRPGEQVKPNRAQRRALPKACPTCGHPIDAADVHFHDDGTLDCAVCGAAIA
jgi:hypothetical protein